jgi:hypothetical protein
LLKSSDDARRKVLCFYAELLLLLRVAKGEVGPRAGSAKRGENGSESRVESSRASIR